MQTDAEVSDQQLIADVLNGLVELPVSYAGGELNELLNNAGGVWTGSRYVSSFTSLQ